MERVLVSKNGFNLRAVRCPKCNGIVVHPADEKEYNDFMALKNKEFEVKMRMVGNSYAVSIPREIVDFMKEQEKMMDDMVRLSFEEAGRISLMFNTPEMQEQIKQQIKNQENGQARQEQQNIQQRIVKAREVQIIRNNKPVFHAKQISDSANPKNNRTVIKQEKDMEEE